MPSEARILSGISAYKNVDPCPHWHFVTYGFSELWAKESADPDVKVVLASS